MRSYTLKEKAKITAGAVAALVIVAWACDSRVGVVIEVIIKRGWRRSRNFVLLLRRHQELCSTPENYGYAGTSIHE